MQAELIRLRAMGDGVVLEVERNLDLTFKLTFIERGSVERRTSFEVAHEDGQRLANFLGAEERPTQRFRRDDLGAIPHPIPDDRLSRGSGTRRMRPIIIDAKPDPNR